MRKNMTTKVKNKKDFEEIRKEYRKDNEKIKERLKKKDYILTVYQIGDEMMSHGEYERQVDTRRFYAVCSLEEIPKYIDYMKQPFWTHEKGLSKKEIKNYPHEKKKWGKYWNVIIEPLSEELEKNYIDARSRKFFETWREIRDDDEKEGK
jgi:hypothetical protein